MSEDMHGAAMPTKEDIVRSFMDELRDDLVALRTERPNALESWDTHSWGNSKLAILAALSEREALLRCEAALRPFAEAWAAANRHKTPMTLAEFGALAMHHCSSVDFRKAHVALTLLDEARK